MWIPKEDRRMSISECLIGIPVSNEPQWTKSPDSLRRYGHIIGMSVNSSGDPIPVVQWAVYSKSVEGVKYDTYAIHQINLKRI